MENSQFIILAAVFIFFLWKWFGQVKPELARQLVASGAVIIDVRTPSEYADGHLENALNIPLDKISGDIARQVPDKNKPVLLYCLSGSRSGIASRLLKNRNYTSVHNLGSFARARSIFSEGKKQAG
ncbi:MAG TPA: rhodanese-like domain-containing protein [Candidatus Rifleibacterium sp.]|nr:rhodanese-like domain-containing protein [Candidatus Rifleibacterium sp.]HPT48305.1 rhodanese-like domain-containing protein [Candidatus Rifleibacterium sp.]